MVFNATFILMDGGGGVVAVVTLDCELPMQSVPITTDIVSSNFDQGKVYNIMW
jgi:hypothetical protein